jgi:hypothetical protein
MLETDPREASGQLIIVKKKKLAHYGADEAETELKMEFKLLILCSTFLRRVLTAQ